MPYPRASTFAFAGAVAAALVISAASAQRLPEKPPAAEDPLVQNFQAEHEIGRRYHIDPNALPAPKTGQIVTNRSLIVPFNGQKLELPPGFSATLFASGLAHPRRLLVL